MIPAAAFWLNRADELEPPWAITVSACVVVESGRVFSRASKELCRVRDSLFMPSFICVAVLDIIG